MKHLFLFVLILALGVSCSNELDIQLIDTSKQNYESLIDQVYLGNGHYGDIQSELAATKGQDLIRKKSKLEIMLTQMDAIDSISSNFIQYIDSLKIDLLENATNAKVDEYMVTKGDGIIPFEFNYDKLASSYSSALLKEESISDDVITRLVLELNALRHDLVYYTGSHNMWEQSFEVDLPEINKATSEEDLKKKIFQAIDESQGNLKEDRQVLHDLYNYLTFIEFDVDNAQIAWMMSRLNNSNVLSILHTFDNIQARVLRARRLALAHWNYKGLSCFDGFTKITSLAKGPNVAKVGDIVPIKVLMAGYDDYRPMFVDVENSELDSLVNGEGFTTVYVKIQPGENTFTGEVAIKNRSGIEKKEPWTWTILGVDDKN